MKFLKPLLLTSVLLLGVVSTLIYTSCEQDRCNGVTCSNGGACKEGTCTCPTGYEDATCSTLSQTRYIGVYAGYSECNSGAQVIDTIFVTADNPKVNTTLKLWQKSHPADTLHGTITSNVTAYQIFIPNLTYTNYNKTYHVTLQNNNSLVMNTVEDNYTNPIDTNVNVCTFVGLKN